MVRFTSPVLFTVALSEYIPTFFPAVVVSVKLILPLFEKVLPVPIIEAPIFSLPAVIFIVISAFVPVFSILFPVPPPVPYIPMFLPPVAVSTIFPLFIPVELLLITAIPVESAAVPKIFTAFPDTYLLVTEPEFILIPLL